MEKQNNGSIGSLDSLKIKQFDSEKDIYQDGDQFSGNYNNHDQDFNYNQIDQVNLQRNSFIPNEEQIYSQQIVNENQNQENIYLNNPYNEYIINNDKKIIYESDPFQNNPFISSSQNSLNNSSNNFNCNQNKDLYGQNQYENGYAGKHVNHTDVLEEDDENVSFGELSPHRKQYNQEMLNYTNQYQLSSQNTQKFSIEKNQSRVQFPFYFKNTSQEYDDTSDDAQRRGSGGMPNISQIQLYARDSIRNVDSVTERVPVSTELQDGQQNGDYSKNNQDIPFLKQQNQNKSQNQLEEYDNQFQKLIKVQNCNQDYTLPKQSINMPLYGHRLSNGMVISEYNSQSENQIGKNSKDHEKQNTSQQTKTFMQNLYSFSPRQDIQDEKQHIQNKKEQENEQNKNQSNQQTNLSKINKNRHHDHSNYEATSKRKLSEQKANQIKKNQEQRTAQIDIKDQQDILNKTQIKCQIKEHDEEKIIMVCVDPYCEAKYRLCCGFCNQLHSNHINSLVKLQEYRFKILQSSKFLGKNDQEQNQKEKDASKINHKELLYLCMQRQNQLYQEIKKHLDGTFLQIQKLVEDKEKNILSFVSSFDEEYNYYLEKLQKLQEKDYNSLNNKDLLKLFNFQKAPQKFIEHQTINDNCRKKQLAELDDIVYDYYVDLQGIFQDCIEQSNNLLYDLLMKLTQNSFTGARPRSKSPTKIKNQLSTPQKYSANEQSSSANKNSQSPLQRFISRTAKSLSENKNTNYMIQKGIPGHKRLEDLPQWCTQMQHVSRAQKKFGPYKFENIMPQSLNLGIQQNIKSDNIYIGDWINFMREGNGIEYSKKDQNYYEGQWKANLKHGSGRLISKNDVVYEGQFEGNKKSGFGTLYQFGGKRYEGMWVNDLPNGQGIQYYPNGDTFSGDFENGIKQGNGTFKYFDGSVLTGVWIKDQVNGICQYIKLDGSRYDGEYKNGKRHGYGTYIWSDGRKYVGNWENGVQSGSGLYTNLNGITAQGIWKNGKKVQQDESDFNRWIVR